VDRGDRVVPQVETGHFLQPGKGEIVDEVVKLAVLNGNHLQNVEVRSAGQISGVQLVQHRLKVQSGQSVHERIHDIRVDANKRQGVKHQVKQTFEPQEHANSQVLDWKLLQNQGSRVGKVTGVEGTRLNFSDGTRDKRQAFDDRVYGEPILRDLVIFKFDVADPEVGECVNAAGMVLWNEMLKKNIIISKS
jgi:hypothetical protein